jgi:hypothetical protein
MPLDPLQDRIARIALGLPEARTLALAGGGAMIVHGFIDRETRDIDLFTEVDDREAVSVAAALRATLERQGLATRDAMRPPHDHRFVVTDAVGGRECTVEVFADGGRLQPRVVLGIGPVPAPRRPGSRQDARALGPGTSPRLRRCRSTSRSLPGGAASGTRSGEGQRLQRRHVPRRAKSYCAARACRLGRRRHRTGGRRADACRIRSVAQRAGGTPEGRPIFD